MDQLENLHKSVSINMRQLETIDTNTHRVHLDTMLREASTAHQILLSIYSV